VFQNRPDLVAAERRRTACAGWAALVATVAHAIASPCLGLPLVSATNASLHPQRRATGMSLGTVGRVLYLPRCPLQLLHTVVCEITG
jgi:hypothetical protein